MSARSGARLPVVVLLVAVLALAGCGSLPTDAQRVRQGHAVEANAEPVLPGVAVKGPTPGSPPERLLADFLLAMRDPSGDFAIARQFLTESASRSWQPSKRPVLVYEGEGSRNIISSGQDTPTRVTKQVSVGAVATLDTSGSYRLKPTATRPSIQVTLVREGQDWRVDGLPADLGAWMTKDAFDRVYAAYALTYISPIDDVFVPDVRWVQRTDVLTRLARLQAAPPPAYLQGAVRTGLPAGASLAVDAVERQGREAVVRLRGTGIGSLDQQQRAWMRAQFTQTLSQSRQVDTVKILLDDAPLDLPSSATFGVALGTPGYVLVSNKQGIAPMLVDRTALRPVQQQPGRQSPTPGGKTAQLPPEDGADRPPARFPQFAAGWGRLAASADARVLLAVNDSTKQLRTWYAGQDTSLVPLPGTVTTATFDEGGRGKDGPVAPGYWVATTGLTALGAPTGLPSTVLWASLKTPDAPGELIAVPTPWLAGRRIMAMRLAPDCTRMAMLLTDPRTGSYVVGLSAVVRDPTTGRPTRLTEPLLAGAPLDEAQDLTFTNGTQVVVIGREMPGNAVRPLHIDLGGDTTAGSSTEQDDDATGSGQRPVEVAARYVASLADPSELYVTDGRGTVFLKFGGAWIPVQTDAEIVLPGE